MPDIDHMHEERKRRVRGTRGAAMATLLLGGLLLWPLASSLRDAGGDSPPIPRDTRVTRSFLSLLQPMRDTVYTMLPCYLELQLDSQVLLRHWDDGRCDSFRVSSGNPSLKKGTATPPGVYLLQSKATLQISKQFDNAKMFNWMQFSGNYGMHALAGSGYYGHLGRRPSSHGCVRLSRESAKNLYASLPLGTPLLIHREAPARVVGFLPPGVVPDTSERSSAEVLGLYRQQLAALYDGARLDASFPVIPLQRRHIRQQGLPVGEAARVPDRQHLPAYYTFAAAQQRWTAGGGSTEQP